MPQSDKSRSTMRSAISREQPLPRNFKARLPADADLRSYAFGAFLSFRLPLFLLKAPVTARNSLLQRAILEKAGILGRHGSVVSLADDVSANGLQSPQAKLEAFFKDFWARSGCYLGLHYEFHHSS